jgi:hypothetical protein
MRAVGSITFGHVLHGGSRVVVARCLDESDFFLARVSNAGPEPDLEKTPGAFELPEFFCSYVRFAFSLSLSLLTG